MSKIKFTKAGSQSIAQDSALNNFIDQLRSTVEGGKLVTPQIGKAAVSLESIGGDELVAFNDAGQALDTALESISNMLFGEFKPTTAQKEAAVFAGLMAGAPKSAMSRSLQITQVSTENLMVIPSQGGGDIMDKRHPALEAYDERDNRNALVYSIAYNYQASRQDEFGETFWPTLTLSNENVGFGVTVNLMQVFDSVERQTTGAVAAFNKKNIIRAVKNPAILKKNSTKITPVYRSTGTTNTDKFSTAVAAADVVLEGETIKTAPLKFGKKIDLLGISQTDTLLAKGVMNNTDALDPTVVLSNVYVKFNTSDVIRFQTLNLFMNNFIASPQDQYKKANLNFTTDGLIVTKTWKNVDGSNLVDLALVNTHDWIVYVEMSVTGSVNLEFGDLEVYGNRIAVKKIVDRATGNEVDLTTGDGATIVTEFANATLDSYDILAYRSNVNRRQQGQLIDVSRFTQLYNVPLRAPITSLHPINNDGSTDASDVQALIATTRIRIANDGVGALLDAITTMSQVVDPAFSSEVSQAMNAIGRYYVVPAFQTASIDMATAINTLSSHQRGQDIQAVLVNNVRDMAYRLYRDSEYQAASDALAGGQGKVPTVIIGTDPVLGRYINLDGEFRTLGQGFDVRIVTTLDERMQGKIVVSFGVFDESRNVSPNPLNFGNLVWAPELVVSANISRGSTSKETVCQPRYLHTWHLPVLGLIQVTNVPDVMNNVPVHVQGLVTAP